MLVASAFARAADAAYESVRDPAEGTMLTVFREMAHSVARQLAHLTPSSSASTAASTAADQDAILAEVLEVAIADGERGCASAAPSSSMCCARRASSMPAATGSC